MTATIHVRLEPASDVSAESTVEIAAAEPPTYLRTSFSIGRDEFARIWRFNGMTAGVARYEFLGDWSNTFPGKWNQLLEPMAANAMDLSDRLIRARPAVLRRTEELGRSTPFRPRKTLKQQFRSA